MIPIKNKKKSLEVTVDEMRNFSFAYIEKYAPSRQQLKTYLLKKYIKTKIPNVNKKNIIDLIDVVLEDLEKRFGAPVLEAYGMTEASHQMSSNPMPPEKRKAGSVGKPTGVKINIMSMENIGQMLDKNKVGEVVIQGENVTSGYHNNDDANKEAYVDGWFRTGDQGFLDDDGYLNLTGRIKELINRGGEKISPLEVDAVLLNHPSVNEAVCFASPDEKYGEVVYAALVINSEVSEKEIQEFCSKSLTSFKIPEKIFFADELPRTATGKIQRRNVAKFFKS